MKGSKKLLTATLCAALFCAAAAGGAAGAFAEEQPVKQAYFRTVETDAEGWSWNGFSAVENDSAFRGWEHGTYSAGGTGEYRFRGSALELVGFRGPAGGSLDVEIDGVKQPRVPLAAEEDKYRQVLARYDALSEDWHTLKVTSAEEGKWHAVDCVRVAMEKDAYLARYNLALAGEIICSVEHPTGGGNKDLNVIRNEKAYPVGTNGLGPAQYDSYTNGARGYFYMGYAFEEELPFSKLVFQEGDTWADGGWFADGDIKVQVRSGGVWKDVTLTEPVGYPVSDKREDFGPSCEIYTFRFETMHGDAIRLIGMTGGTGNFVSVSQIEAYADADAATLAGGYDYRAATVYELGSEEPEPEPEVPGTDGPSSSEAPGGNEAKPNTGLIVGLSVGGAVLIGGAVAAVLIVRKRKRGERHEDKED